MREYRKAPYLTLETCHLTLGLKCSQSGLNGWNSGGGVGGSGYGFGTAIGSVVNSSPSGATVEGREEEPSCFEALFPQA